MVLGRRGYKQLLQGSARRPALSRVRIGAFAVNGYGVVSGEKARSPRPCLKSGNRKAEARRAGGGVRLGLEEAKTFGRTSASMRRQPPPPEGAGVLQGLRGGSRLLLAPGQQLDTAQVH